MISKRIFDIIFSLAVLIIFLPLFGLIAISIKINSNGPVFFRQPRVGLKGKLFKIHKFRTMYHSCAPNLNIVTKNQDVRITNVGYYLRKYKLDEIPQFIDVLIGKMSVVGPRPEVPVMVELYSNDFRDCILSVRPGITDWASLHFRNESESIPYNCDSNEHYVTNILPIKLSLQKDYVLRRNIFEDFRIVYLTGLAILR